MTIVIRKSARSVIAFAEWAIILAVIIRAGCRRRGCPLTQNGVFEVVDGCFHFSFDILVELVVVKLVAWYSGQLAGERLMRGQVVVDS